MSPPKDLGTRHACWNCGTKFYDLKKPEPACPKCGSDPRLAPVVKDPPRAARKASPAAAETVRSIDDDADDDRPVVDDEPILDDETEDFAGDDDDDADEDI